LIYPFYYFKKIWYNLTIIIVNYNTVDFLHKCLKTVANNVDKIIVVDNASWDNSKQMVCHEFPHIKLIANSKNLGFSKANNQALEMCESEYLYFLNPDTEVMSGALESMVDFMNSHTDVGLAGTRIINPDGSLQPSV
jgi:GT2 family glycosyltransferase